MRRSLILMLVVHTAMRLSPAEAYSTGISGYSGKQGSICSTLVGCHTSAAPKAPTVQFTGPTDVPAQSVAAFQFIVHSRAQAQKFAGFDVAASGGILVPGTCNGLPGDCQHHVAPFMDEITHIAPQENDVAGDCIFEFTWQAPSTPGNYILYGAGNSVNRDAVNTGDKPAATTFMVNVIADTPSATPTETNTPPQPTVPTTPTPSNSFTAQPTSTASAPPTETLTPSSTRTPSSSPTDPPSSPTSSPSPSPMDTPSPSLTETPTTTSTPAVCIGDCNQDRQITTDELLAGMRIALGGIDLPICESLLVNASGSVTIDVLLTACNRGVTDCAAP